MNLGALFLKFGSTEDHCSYNSVKLGDKLRYRRSKDSVSSSSWISVVLVEGGGDNGNLKSGNIVR
jgi:hypothetical protein